MVEKWDRMGVIAERPGPEDAERWGMPRSLWVETEVWEDLLANDASYQQLLIAEGAVEPPRPEALPEAGLRLVDARAVPEFQPQKGHARLRLRRDEA
jgi:hypothetical protein